MKFRIFINAGLILASGFCGEALAQGPQAPSNTRQFSGVASYYNKNYSGRTASGATYDSGKLTAAHRTLPFGTRVAVTDPRSKRVVTVVVNDRGPFIKGRVLDLSYSAAQALRMTGRGLMKVNAAIE